MKIFCLAAKQQILMVVSLWRSPLTFVWPVVPKYFWLVLIRVPSDCDWNTIWLYFVSMRLHLAMLLYVWMKSKAHLKLKHNLKKKRIWLHGGHNIAYWPKQVRRSFVCLSTSPNAKTCVLLKISKWKGSFSYIQSSVRTRHCTGRHRRRRAGKGAPKTLIFAIYFKPKCEELLLDLTVW